MLKPRQASALNLTMVKTDRYLVGEEIEEGGGGGRVRVREAGWTRDLGARCERVGGSSRSRVRRDSLAVSIARSLEGELVLTAMALFPSSRYH